MLAGALAPAAATRADEGMWLVNKPPLAVLRERYNFDPSPALLEHLRLSAINFGGASGSFVSPRGLVMTNHHVGSDAIAELSTAERNLLETGFVANTPAEELKCPNMELRVLLSIEDVTERVLAAVKPGLDAPAAEAARRAAIVEIEAQARAAMLGPRAAAPPNPAAPSTPGAPPPALPAAPAPNGPAGSAAPSSPPPPALTPESIECVVVALYHGGRYHLYTSRRFTDVRLVFAPELGIAAFGGDTHNFEYPRFCLDLCLFRVYENGRPYEPRHALRFAPRGAKAGDLALVFGHPGRTQRLLTVEDLRFQRDVELPGRLQAHWRDEQKLTAFCNRSAEHRRIGGEALAGVANARKARAGMLAGLLDPALMAAKAADEARLRAAVAGNIEWKARWEGAWDQVAAAIKVRRAIHERAALIGAPRLGTLFGHALTLVRLGEELKKPSAERLPAYREARLPRLYQDLYSEAPVHALLEVELLANGLSYLAERFGAEDPLVVKLLAGLSPRARAEQVIAGTDLATVSARRRLAETGGAPAERADPMIELARAIEPESRALLLKLRDEVEAVERDAYAKIAQARFAIDGEKIAPDATGTLRLSFGAIKGYSEGGTAIEPFTDFAGLFRTADERAGDAEFRLPARWVEARKDLDPMAPFNFVCTADIIGGNSGSPVVNEAGDVIGLIFDGNVQSLPGAFRYSEEQARAVSVDSRGILEALRTVYKADALARELEGK